MNMRLPYIEMKDEDEFPYTEQSSDKKETEGLTRAIRKIQDDVTPFLERMAKGEKIKVSEVRNLIHDISTVCFVAVGPVKNAEKAENGVETSD